MNSILPSVNIAEDRQLTNSEVLLEVCKIFVGAILYILGLVYVLKLTVSKSQSASMTAFIIVSIIEILYIFKVL